MPALDRSSRFVDALLALCVLAGLGGACTSAWAQGGGEDTQDVRVLAQAAPVPSIDKIRAQAQRMKEYREVLADRDPNVRLAALEEMLKSSDAAMRELAYDVAFASADSNLRATALRSKILSMKSLVVELENTAKLPDEEWTKLLVQLRGPKHVFKLDKAEPQSGSLMANGRPAQVSGQELSITISVGAIRLRLGDGGVMTGTMTYLGNTAPARLTLQ